VKLYDIPRNTEIDISHLNLEADGEKITQLHFHHINGMYSHCTWKGKVIHLPATTDVKIAQSTEK